MKKQLLSRLILLSLFFIGITNVIAQQEFKPRQNISTKGDVLLIGNTILGLTSNPPNNPYNTTGTNNGGSGFETSYIDIDGDNTTFSSSSADLDDPNAGCTEILYAGLYWTANYYLARENDPDTSSFGPGEISSNDALASNTILNINNGEWAGDFAIRPTELDNDNSDVKLSPASSNLVVADGCSIVNASELVGNIAVMSTGGACTDREKIVNAQNAGAIGAIIVNSNANHHQITGAGTLVTIPSGTIGNNDIAGLSLIDVIDAATNVINATISTTGNEVLTGLPITDVRSTGTADYRNIQLGFGAPGAVTYTTVQPQTTAQVIDVNGVPTTTNSGILYDGYLNTVSNPGTEASDNVPYSCYADVTSIVQANGYGTYTVANMKATLGITSGVSGAAGGWSLLVIYKDPGASATNRFISVSDGFREILGGASPSSVDLPISGFTTLPAPNPVRVKFGISSLEGDNGISGDNLQIRNTSDFYVDIFNAANPQNNFFNSSISVDGQITTNRNPASLNTLGYDTDLFELPNDAKDLIANGDTSADFRLETNGDSYQAFMTVFSIEDISSELTMVKNVLDNNLVNITGGTVEFGDQIFYEISAENTGNDDLTNVTITDALSDNVDFVPSSITAPVGVTFDYNDNTRTVTFNIPDNLVEQSDDPITMRYGIQVVTNCESLRDACSDEVSNTATSNYTGIVSGITSSGNSSSTIDACGNTDGLETSFSINFTACSSDISFCGGSLQLVAGTGYDQYVWSGPNGFSTTTTVNFVDVPSAVSGVYSVVKNDTNPADGTCVSLTEEFNVTSFSDLAHPLQDNAVENEVEYFDFSNGGCGVPLAQISLCGDQTYIVDSGFVAANLVSITWEELTASACFDRTDNCPAVAGGCDVIANWTDISPAPLTTSLELSDAGEYRMVVEFDGGCTQVFYFDINKNDYQPQVDIVDMQCSNIGTVQVNNIPPSGAFRFLISDSAAAAPTLPADIGLFTNAEGFFEIPFQVNPFNFTVYAVDTTLPNCVYQITSTVQSFDPQVNISVNHPECANNDNGNGLGSIMIEVIGGTPTYEYRILGGPNNIDVVTGNEAATNGDYTFNDLEPGNYTIQVVSNRNPDPECFQEFANVVIDPAPEFTAIANLISPATCDTGAVVEVVVTAGSGGPYEYADQGGVFSTDNRFTLPTTALPTDTFTFQVADTSTIMACVIEADITAIAAYVPIEIETAVPTNPVCPTDGGSIAVAVTANSAIAGRTFTFDLLDNLGGVVQTNTTSSLDFNFTNIPVGTGYKVRVSHNNTTDPTGITICPKETSTFDITAPGEVSFDANVTRELSCSLGNEAAQITINNFTGGGGGYEWAIDAAGPFTPVSGGSAVIEVATAQANFAIYVRGPNTPDCPVASTVSIAPIETVDNLVFTEGTSSCTNQTIEITVAAEPAGPTYTYSATPAPITGDGVTGVFTLETGINYTFTTTRSDNECTYTESFLANPISPLEITNVVTTENITCNGSNDGVIQFSVNSSDFDYEITDVTGTPVTNGTSTVNTVSVGGLGAGDYIINASDVNLDCPATAQFSVSEPAPLQTQVDVTQPTINTAGSIIVNTTGGTSPYEYSSDGGNTFVASNTFENLSEGEYYISVRDSKECIVVTQGIIIDTSPGELSVELILDNAFISCFGENDASINSIVTGGSGSYTYTLTGTDYLGGSINTSPQSDGSFSNLAAGDYTYLVDSPNNGSQSVPFSIAQPQELFVTFESTDINCNGDDNGTIIITADGGTLPYEYTISSANGIVNSTSSQGVFENLAPGTYSTVTTDANGCTQETVVEIAEPDVLQASIFAMTSETCLGDSDGTVTIQVEGGTPPYATNITNNDADFVEDKFTYDTLPSGTTTIFVRDSNNCRLALSVDILEGTSLDATLSERMDCPVIDANTGAITQPPVYYVDFVLGDNSTTTDIIYTLEEITGNTTIGTLSNTTGEFIVEPGTYEAILQHVSGCAIVVGTITIAEYRTMEISTAITNPTIAGENGLISVSVVNGRGPYTFILDEGAPFSADNNAFTFVNVPVGKHKVTVQDGLGCISEAEDVIIVEEEKSPIIEYADEIFFCTITGQSYPVITIEDEQGEELELLFTDTVSIVWQKLDEITCDIELEDNCPTSESSCSSDWFDIATGNSNTMTEPGEYRVVINFANRLFNNTQVYYFKVEKNIPDVNEEIIMYPNPSRNDVTINADVKTVKVFDTMGKIVLQTSEKSYSIAALRDGVYFAEVETKDNRKIIIKLIKK